MHIGIDIDDTITHAPEFFAALTHGLTGAEVTVVTFRPEVAGSVETLRECGVRYDRIVVSTDPELGCPPGVGMGKWKAGVVKRLGIDVFFDDAPEVVQAVEAPAIAFMCCDAFMRRWLKGCLARA